MKKTYIAGLITLPIILYGVYTIATAKPELIPKEAPPQSDISTTTDTIQSNTTEGVSDMSSEIAILRAEIEALKSSSILTEPTNLVTETSVTPPYTPPAIIQITPTTQQAIVTKPILPETTPKEVQLPIEIKAETPTTLTTIELIQKVKPSVVHISNKNSSGSGVVIDSTGYILTNAHVVSSEYKTSITFSDGSISEGLVVGKDIASDIAIIKTIKNNLTQISIGNSNNEALAQGQDVYTFGFPFGVKGDVSFKDGTLSRRLTYEGIEYLEISAEIHPGNSGGPLINAEGEVVGINTLLLGISGDTIKLSLPINEVMTRVSALKENEKVWTEEDIITLEEFTTFDNSLSVVLQDIWKSIELYRTLLANSYDSSFTTTADTEAIKILDDVQIRARGLSRSYPKDLPYSFAFRGAAQKMVQIADKMKMVINLRMDIIDSYINSSYYNATLYAEGEDEEIAKTNTLLSEIEEKNNEIITEADAYFLGI